MCWSAGLRCNDGSQMGTIRAGRGEKVSSSSEDVLISLLPSAGLSSAQLSSRKGKK